MHYSFPVERNVLFMRGFDCSSNREDLRKADVAGWASSLSSERRKEHCCSCDSHHRTQIPIAVRRFSSGAHSSALSVFVARLENPSTVRAASGARSSISCDGVPLGVPRGRRLRRPDARPRADLRPELQSRGDWEPRRRLRLRERVDDTGHPSSFIRASTTSNPALNLGTGRDPSPKTLR